MPNLYVDRPLNEIVQARVAALSDPDAGVVVSEREALVDMLEQQYTREYKQRKGS